MNITAKNLASGLFRMQLPIGLLLAIPYGITDRIRDAGILGVVR